MAGLTSPLPPIAKCITMLAELLTPANGQRGETKFTHCPFVGRHHQMYKLRLAGEQILVTGVHIEFCQLSLKNIAIYLLQMTCHWRQRQNHALNLCFCVELTLPFNSHWHIVHLYNDMTADNICQLEFLTSALFTRSGGAVGKSCCVLELDHIQSHLRLHECCQP